MEHNIHMVLHFILMINGMKLNYFDPYNDFLTIAIVLQSHI